MSLGADGEQLEADVGNVKRADLAQGFYEGVRVVAALLLEGVVVDAVVAAAKDGESD